MVDPEDPAVKVQAFQTEILTLGNQLLQQRGASLSESQQAEWNQGLLQLAYTYAQFDPEIPPNESLAQVPGPDPLFKLWKTQAEYGSDLDVSAADLTALLKDIPNDRLLPTLKFLHNLLLAANEVQSLNDNGGLRDRTVLRELVKLGVEYAKANPDTSLSQEPQGWLDMLWRTPIQQTEDNQQKISQAAQGLSEFLKGSGAELSRDSITKLEFGQRILRAARQSVALQPQTRSPQFLDALLGLGRAYAALEPESVDTETEDQTDSFLLYTLLISESEQGIQTGSSGLEEFLQDFQPNQWVALMNYQREVFDAARKAFQGQELVYPSVPVELQDLTDLTNTVASLSGGAPNPYQAQYGRVVEQNIVADYEIKHPDDRLLSNNYISTILKEYQAYLPIYRDLTDGLRKDELSRKPDLFNFDKDFLYEIKNFKDEPTGVTQVGLYLSIFQKAGLDFVKLGPTTEQDGGVYGVVPAPNIGGVPSYAIYISRTPGVIIYKGVKNKSQADPQLSSEEILRQIRKAQEKYKVPLAVIILAIIISEVSRLFLPRNLVPIP